MKYAMINGNKAEAEKGAKGQCPNCGAEVIAKCGERKISHWAHKSIRNCDAWWENETEWHRSWKNYYPADWQELPMRDEFTNEKHVADIRTKAGLVLEFQHSAIHPDERKTREAFYKNMVWLVDGTRLKYDYARFKKGIYRFENTEDPHVFYFKTEDEYFPSAWLGSSVPVIFDFKGTVTIDDPEDPRNYLYCVQSNIKGRNPFFAKLTHQEFISSTISGEWPSLIKKWFDKPNKYDQARQAFALEEAMQNARNSQIKKGSRWREYLPILLIIAGFVFSLVSLITHYSRRKRFKKAFAIANRMPMLSARNKRNRKI